jgi:hypothetical protein
MSIDKHSLFIKFKANRRENKATLYPSNETHLGRQVARSKALTLFDPHPKSRGIINPSYRQNQFALIIQ